MTLAELRTAVQARGFDHLDTTTLNRFINQSYQELCEAAAWPFLEASASGTAPLSVTDVRTVLNVTDTTTGSVLSGMDRRDVVDLDPGLDDTGTPSYWYLDDTTLRVYPLNTTDTISVRYIEVPDELSSDSSTPDVPTRYQEMIVDGAVIRAYKTADELDAAAALRADWEAGVERMRRVLLNRNFSNPDFILITDSEGWSH